MTMRHILAIVIASQIAVSAFAQGASTINVHVVELPVSVLDASGKPVRGLTAANFVLYDEKRKQPITSFDAIDFARHDAVSAISPHESCGPPLVRARVRSGLHVATRDVALAGRGPSFCEG